MKEKVSYWLAVLFLVTVLVGAFAAWSAKATEVYRGGEESSLTETVESGVSVVRGQSNFPVYQTRESESAPAVSQAGQDMDAWFRAYDAWRAKWIYRKLHPRP